MVMLPLAWRSKRSVKKKGQTRRQVEKKPPGLTGGFQDLVGLGFQALSTPAPVWGES
jgi:hypothetical protein